MIELCPRCGKNLALVGHMHLWAPLLTHAPKAKAVTEKSCDEKSSAPCDANSGGDLKPHASPSAKARQRSAFRRQTAIAAPPTHARDPAR